MDGDLHLSPRIYFNNSLRSFPFPIYVIWDSSFLLARALDVEKGKKSSTDLVIEKSVELYGFTPNEKSDENLKWMLENGYLIKQVQRVRA